MFSLNSNQIPQKSGILIIKHTLTEKCLTIPSQNLRETFDKTVSDLENQIHFSAGLQYLYDQFISPDVELDNSYIVIKPTTSFKPFLVSFIELKTELINTKWDQLVRASFRYQLVQYRNTRHVNLRSLNTSFAKVRGFNTASNYEFVSFSGLFCGIKNGYGNYSGIYRITIQDDYKSYIYVGKSKFIAFRWGWHLRELNDQNHHNPIMYRLALNNILYDTTFNLKFEVLQYVSCHYDNLLTLEKKWALKQTEPVISSH